MIERGEKLEEYREIKAHWINRLLRYGDNEKLNGRLYANFLESSQDVLKYNIGSLLHFEKFEVVKFSYGYTKRTMTFEIKDITIGHGRPEWGAPEEEVFIIKRFI